MLYEWCEYCSKTLACRNVNVTCEFGISREVVIGRPRDPRRRSGGTRVPINAPFSSGVHARRVHCRDSEGRARRCANDRTCEPSPYSASTRQHASSTSKCRSHPTLVPWRNNRGQVRFHTELPNRDRTAHQDEPRTSCIAPTFRPVSVLWLVATLPSDFPRGLLPTL